MASVYNDWLVALSIVVAILVSYTALRLAARSAGSEGEQGRIWHAAAAVTLGVGIWLVNFIGMLSLTLPFPLAYGLPMTLASLAIAILTCGFALAITSSGRATILRLGASAAVLGTGMAAMHYLGMAAITVVPSITYDYPLVGASLLIAVGGSFAALWLFQQLREGNSGQQRLVRIGAAAVMGGAISGMHYTGMAAARFALGSFCRGGVNFDNGWLAATIGIFAFALLVVMLVTAVYESHLQSSTRTQAQRLQRANAELQHQATHDALTGLPNRVLFLDRLGQEIVHAERNGHAFAVFVVDLDRFKTINDTLGHSAGDQLLIDVTRRLSATLRRVDTVARTGGDEFLMLISCKRERSDAAAVATKIGAALDKAFTLHSAEIHTSASIGISMYPVDGTDTDTLVAHADEAMYCAKKRGRNNFQFFDPENSAFSHERLDLENDLRRALSLQQLELHYQPKFDVASGRMSSVEALLRWRHPTRGMLSPDEFIPLAEETGLIFAIGEWVLRQASRQARSWQRQGLPFLRIAVNVSPVHFRQTNFLKAVQTALHDNDLEPQYLEIELTESTMMDHAKDAVAIIEELSRMGVVVSIDDFGSGYTSMSYLRRFPIDKLKIDRSFICELTTNADAESIVKAIICLAHSLRLRVVAEGVETAAQLERLRELGCDQYQGFYRSAGVLPAEIENTILSCQGNASPRDQEQYQRTYSKLSAYKIR